MIRLLIILGALAALLATGCNTTGVIEPSDDAPAIIKEATATEASTDETSSETTEAEDANTQSVDAPARDTVTHDIHPVSVPPPNPPPIKSSDADEPPDPANDLIPDRQSLTQDEIKEIAKANGCYPSCEGAAIRRGEVPLTKQEEEYLRENGVLSPDVKVPRSDGPPPPKHGNL